MNTLPYPPKKPLPAVYFSEDVFLYKYHIQIGKYVKNTLTLPHYHDYFQLYFVISGTFKETINGEDILCDEGSVVLIMPYTIHSPDTTDMPSDAEIIAISFLPEELSGKGIPFVPLTYKTGAYKNKLLPTYFHIREEDMPLATRLMREIYSEYQKKSDMFLTKIFNNLNTFLALCAETSADTISPHGLSVASSRAMQFGRIIGGIKKRCNEKWLIDDAARSSMMSRSTFTKNFREVTGMTYHDIVTQIRLTRARDILRFTQKSIGEISEEVGFSSNAHFTKECIKIFTLPPQPLRRKMAERTRLRMDEISQRNEELAWSRIRPSEITKEHFNNSIGKKD